MSRMLDHLVTVWFGVIATVTLVGGCVGLLSPANFRRWFPLPRRLKEPWLPLSDFVVRVMCAWWIVVGGWVLFEMWPWSSS
jgi:hypothetical protein